MKDSSDRGGIGVPPEGRAPLSMHAALLRGGLHDDLPGQTRAEVLAAVSALPGIPAGVDRRVLRDLLVSREELASTGIGRGVAVPHPRDPLVVHVDEPVVLLCFLRQPVDFQAIDGLPVRVLFTVFSPSVRIHLRLLARLAWLLHDERLGQLLIRRAPASDILGRIATLEHEIPAHRPESQP